MRAISYQLSAISRPRGFPAWRPGGLFSQFAVLLPLVLAGCQATMPHAATQPAPPAGNAELMEFISEQAFVTADAGYRGVYALWKGQSYAGDFGALREELLTGRVASSCWSPDSQALLTRAQVGYMVCRACGINSGLNWLLTGCGRYAWRELQYKGIAGAGSEFGRISGGEFLGIMSKADDYLYKRKAAGAAKAELGERPKRAE